jgi:hypothetical protein
MKEWVIGIDSALVEELAAEFERGPLLSDGDRLLEEQTVAWLCGLKIEVFSREHPPPHFRVSYQRETNNFDLCTGEPLEGKALRKWHRNIKKWHHEHRDDLIRTWNKARPTDCPVGKVKC